ncbi:MAG: caspase family protein, partial [Actinobacteria bacterium]|nr:caspase family protein [Actinomycetota bacterium]
MRRGTITRMFAAMAAVTLGSLVAPGAAHAGPAPNAPRRALIIGVSNYEPPTVPTVGSANDARDMHDVLVRDGWPESSIRVLIDGDATMANIRDGIEWLVSNSSPNSFSIFHYSGHTKQIESGYDDGDAEDWDEYMWSVDNQFLSDGEFANRMRAIQGQAWINVSACEAAGFDDGISSPSRLVTTASREDQKGYERYDTKRSIFTGLLTDAFLHDKGDANHDGSVSIQEAFAYAAEWAPQFSVNGEHGPQNPVMAGGDNTQWLLGAPSPAAAATGTQQSLI